MDFCSPDCYSNNAASMDKIIETFPEETMQSLIRTNDPETSGNRKTTWPAA